MENLRSSSTPIVLPGSEDTIAAIATAPGRGAISVLRLSGNRAHAIAARVLTPWDPTPRKASLATLHGKSDRAVIDRGVIVVYTAPDSYTGEDSVEISVHGGALVPALALSALIEAGARLALPGEFTRRAVANGKMDLVQAEAVADIVDARSTATHHQAVAQLDGSLSRRIEELRAAVLDLEALIAYDIDFPDEDDGPIAPERVERGIKDLLSALDALLATARTGEILREGALVVIAGPPNVGKSSLFNALLGRQRAIVTETPGTTRDALEAVIDMAGWPVRLIDTAGLRSTADVVERLGIEVSERYLAAAHLVLACGDTDALALEAAAKARALSSAPLLSIRTKADLISSSTSNDNIVADSYLSTDQTIDSKIDQLVTTSDELTAVSAITGEGLGVLCNRIAAVLGASSGDHTPDVPVLTRERHRLAVERARAEVVEFERAWRAGDLPATVAAVHLRTASALLGEVIGLVGVEDVLDRVFGSFCVGK